MKKAMKQSLLMPLLNGACILFLAAILFCFLGSIRADEKDRKASADRYDLSHYADQFLGGSANLTNEVRAYAATGDPAHFDNYWNEINTLKNRDIGVENLKRIGITQAEQKCIDKMAELSNNLVPLESQAMDMVKAGNQEGAIEAVYGEAYEKTIGEIRSVQAEFLSMLDARTTTQSDALAQDSRLYQSILFGLIVSIGLLLIVTTVIMVTKVLAPMVAIQREMRAFASGRFDTEFHMQPDTSEIGQLVQAILEAKGELRRYIYDISEKLNRMARGDFAISADIEYIGDFVPIQQSLTMIIESMNRTLAGIDTASHEVMEYSHQIAGGTQTLACSCEEQSAAIGQITQAIGEVSTRSTHSDALAARAADLSGQIMTDAQAGLTRMETMKQAVQEINSASNRIHTVIQVIDDIAFQTNILSLNAAVEAARAGQHGKGFAVVAEEVRNLAAKSAEAARDTGLLITDSIGKAQTGAIIAQETTEAFANIVANIHENNRVIRNIASASQEQTIAVQEANHGITQIQSSVLSNSSAAQENAANSEHMCDQSQELIDLVSKFRLQAK